MSKIQEHVSAAPNADSPPARRRSKTLAAAVVLSLTALYCTSGPQSPSTGTRTQKAYDLEVKSPLPKAPYALCSPLGEEGPRSRSIYTVDANNSRVECILVKKGRIAASGDLQTIQSLYTRIEDDKLEVVRIPIGTIVLPGITDSHCHILEYGFSRDIPLESAKSVEEAVNLVGEYVKSHPDVTNDPSRIIEGFGWNHKGWAVPVLPTAADLSSHPLLANRQIILSSKDGHASWVSRATLELDGPYPESIEGGVIVRDKATGGPTGVFIDTAQSLITPAVITPEMQRQRFQNTVKDALRAGLTSLHDAGVYPGSLEFFERESKRPSGLPLRVYAMTWFNASSLPSDDSAYWGDRAPKVLELDGQAKFASRSVKIFADGALRTAGAALYEPYSDDPTTSGQLRFGPEGFNKVIPKFLKDGWQVNVHAIGDRANGVILDAFQLALDAMNMTTFEGSHLRPRLEHAQILAKKDVERLKRMGVIASVQPTHISDMWYAEDRLGPERVKQLYPFQSILKTGARITLGSDFPVEGVNPLAGFHAAITRLSPDGKSPHGPGGWFPNERLTRTQALRGMTIDPAYASFTEHTLGSLEPGKKADFVVLSQDIMTIHPERILETEVVATVIDGEVVYEGV